MAAIDWQQAEQESPTTALAVHVAELDYRADLAEPAPLALARKVAERGFPGDILATEIVRMLTPMPSSGRWWGDLATSIGEPAQLVHRIDWPRSGGAARSRSSSLRTSR